MTETLSYNVPCCAILKALILSYADKQAVTLTNNDIDKIILTINQEGQEKALAIVNGYLAGLKSS